MTFAYCWASGLIQFGPRCPDGAIEIARGPLEPLRRLILPAARMAYDGNPLVPGVPEANASADDMAAIDALIAWRAALTQRSSKNVQIAGAI